MTCWHGIQKVSPLAPVGDWLGHVIRALDYLVGIRLKLISTETTFVFAIFPALFCFPHLPFPESIFPKST